MTEESKGVLAQKVEVHRHEETVGLLLEVEVTSDDLAKLDPGEPLLVLAAFEDHSKATRLRRALGKAIDDAAAARARRKSGSELAHLPKGLDTAPRTAGRGVHRPR